MLDMVVYEVGRISGSVVDASRENGPQPAIRSIAERRVKTYVKRNIITIARAY